MSHEKPDLVAQLTELTQRLPPAPAALPSVDESQENESEQETEPDLVEAAREEVAEFVASLLLPLTEHEQAFVDSVVDGEGRGSEVLASFTTSLIPKKTLVVHRESMETLKSSAWLNDEVINFYYGLLSERDKEECTLAPQKKRSYFFNTSFMDYLLNKDNRLRSKQGKYEYANVKRWSKNVPGKSIFDLDKLYFPIQIGKTHWICIVANMTSKRIEAYDSMHEDQTDLVEAIFCYIQDEYMDKMGVSLPDIDEWELFGSMPGVPFQTNSM